MRRGGRFAFTFVEAMVALAVMVGVLGLLISVFYLVTRWTGQGQEHALGLEEMRLASAKLVREVRACKQLVYPLPGSDSQPGLGLVTALGEMVVYRLVPSASGTVDAPSDLVRESVAGKREVVLSHVSRVLVTTSDLDLGADALLVRIVASRAFPVRPGAADVGIGFATSAYARSRRSACLATRGQP